MRDNNTTQEMLTRLAQYRESLAHVGDLPHTRYNKAENNLLTQAVNEYWRDMSTYYEQEHDG